MTNLLSAMTAIPSASAVPPAGSDVVFRDASLSDVTAVVELVQSAYRGESSRRGWTTEADLLDGSRIDPGTVREYVSAPRSLVMIAYPQALPYVPGAPDELLACCQLAAGDESVGYFGMFAVRPALQNRGIGRALVAEAERRAITEWGCSALRMLVICHRTELIAWYERLGFALTGATSPFPYGDERFGVPKRSDLVFVELQKALRIP